MTNKDFKEGMPITCSIGGAKVNDAKLHYEDGDGYICHNVGALDEGGRLGDYLGYEYSLNIYDDGEEGEYGVTNLQPEPRTIDDLKEGDIIVDKDGYKKKCLARIGEVYAVSKTWGSVIPDNEVKTHSFGATIYELKNYGYTLYQEPTPTDDTIEIEGVKYKVSSVKEALKNFNK